MAARHEIHHHHHHHDHDDGHGDDDQRQEDLGGARARGGENRHDHHDHGHDEFESFVVELPEIADPDRLHRAVERAVAAHGLLRVKGFAAVANRPMRLVLQAVGPRLDSYYDRPFAGQETRQTRLVVIGMAGLDREAITAALAQAA